MSSAAARGSDLLESVDDLKEEEVEDGKTHMITHVYTRKCFLPWVLRLGGVATLHMLWKGNCFQASHRPLELL